MRGERVGPPAKARRVFAMATVVAAALATVVTAPARATTFVVTTTGDSGPGTLRDAITLANRNPGADVITFNIASFSTSSTVIPGQTFTIPVVTALPPITGPVLIDGTSQPGFVPGGLPVIIVQGRPTGPVFDGLVVTGAGGGTTVRNLALAGFDDAVEVDGATATTISANLLGLLPSGAAGPNVNGVHLAAGSNGTIVSANTISGNTGRGVVVEGSTANRVTANRIGTDPTGTAAVGNGLAGVLLGAGSTGNLVGEPGAGNVISGNGLAGVEIEGASPDAATANVIAGNIIGADVSGSAAIGNAIGIFADSSVDVVGGAVAGAGNLISGNPGGGLHANLFGMSGFVVKGNSIGTNAAGTGLIPNGFNGVSLSGGSDHVIGGPSAAEGNLVSGNVRGIDVDSASNLVIQGNLVGTDVTGTVALGNSNGGIQVASGLGHRIGGPAGAGNVISGNAGAGLVLLCDVSDPLPTSAVIEGNRVGTDWAGDAAVANTGDGVALVGCATGVGVVANVIAANLGRGVVDGATGSSILGNVVGTDASGALALGNGSHGIELGGSGATVGGPDPGGPNTIAFNGGAGVAVSGSAGNAIRANSVHDNAALGIDLAAGAVGVTPNDPGDADLGPNQLQNFPVLASAQSGPSTIVTGTLQSLPATTFGVDLYGNAACDPSGFGEGQTYLATVAVTTDASGAASFSAAVSAGAGFITATATDPAGNTSEFSACRAVTPPPGVSVSDVTASEGSGAAVVTVSVPAPALQDVSVTLATADGTATAPADYLATSRTVIIPAGQQSATVSVPIVDDALDESDETFTITLSNPVGAVLGAALRTVTIVDNDPTPSLTVNDPVVLEGNAGTTALTFTVSLSAPSGRPVTVDVATGGGTATPGTDYVPVTTTLTLAPGVTSAAVVVTVLGDTVSEPDEYLLVTLSNPTNAVVADATGIGVIATDDAAPPSPLTTTTTTTSTTTPPTTATTATTSTTTATVPSGPQTRIITITPTTADRTRILVITPPAVPPPPVATVAQPPAATTTTATTTATTTTTTTTATSTTTVAPTTTPSTATTSTTASASTSTSTSSPAPPTTTGAAPTTPPAPTVPTSAPPAAGSATLLAAAPDGTPGGSPGVGLDVSGAGYTGCGTVYFFFDGVRVGSGHPDAAGAVAVKGLSVPGDAGTGARRVTSACQPTGAPQALAPFTVMAAAVHRSAFLTALPQPRQVRTDSGAVATSAIVAVVLLILLAFPSQLFNATLTENYDEIRGWFRLPRRVFDTVGAARQTLAFAVFAVLGGLTYSLLSPDFGLNRSSFALLAGMIIAVIIVTVGFCVPSAVYMRRTYGEWGKIAVLPGSLVVGLVCVTLSRLFHFQPGYLYGVLAGVVFGRALRAQEQGRLSAVTSLFVLGVSLGAWALRVPVSAAAAEPGAGAWLVAMEACLGAVFLLGLESVVVGLLPMRFLDGARLRAWSGLAWGVLFATALFALIHVLLSPGSGYVGHTSGGVTIAVVVLYVIFGAVSVMFWAYFRYRPERWIPRSAR